MKQVYIDNLSDLSGLEELLPDGTTCDITGMDFTAGNFDTAHLKLPQGETLDYRAGRASQLLFGDVEVVYSGPVAEELRR